MNNEQLKQSAKDQAAREIYQTDFINAMIDIIGDDRNATSELINRAMEIYAEGVAKEQWNAAIEKAAESAEAFIGVKDEPIVSKGSILKLKKP